MENKIRKYIGLTIVIGILVFSLFLVKNILESSVKYNKSALVICHNYYKQERKGKIIKNRYSRGQYVTDLSNGTTCLWYCRDNVQKTIWIKDSVITWELLEIGDSIYKPANTFDVYLYKQANPDSLIILECNHNCNIWLKGQVVSPLISVKSTTRDVKTQELKKVRLKWNFNKKHEKYIKGFVILRKRPDTEKVDSLDLLSPDTRNFTDSLFPELDKNLNTEKKYYYFRYELVVKFYGLKDKKKFSDCSVPYINLSKKQK